MIMDLKANLLTITKQLDDSVHVRLRQYGEIVKLERVVESHASPLPIVNTLNNCQIEDPDKRVRCLPKTVTPNQ